MTGLLSNAGSSHAPITEIFNAQLNTSGHGDDENDDESTEERSTHSILMQQLRTDINPMSASSVWGIDLYVHALELLR